MDKNTNKKTYTQETTSKPLFVDDFEQVILKGKYQLAFRQKAGGFGEVYIAKHI